MAGACFTRNPENLLKRPTKGTKVWPVPMAYPKNSLTGLAQLPIDRGYTRQPCDNQSDTLNLPEKARWPAILGWLLGLTWILLKLNLPDDLYWRRTELNKETDNCPFPTRGLKGRRDWGLRTPTWKDRANNYSSKWLILGVGDEEPV